MPHELFQKRMSKVLKDSMEWYARLMMSLSLERTKLNTMPELLLLWSRLRRLELPSTKKNANFGKGK